MSEIILTGRKTQIKKKQEMISNSSMHLNFREGKFFIEKIACQRKKLIESPGITTTPDTKMKRKRDKN